MSIHYTPSLLTNTIMVLLLGAEVSFPGVKLRCLRVHTNLAVLPHFLCSLEHSLDYLDHLSSLPLNPRLRVSFII